MRGTLSAEPLTVFISGRLKEMAAERLAAGAVVAAMRLRPIIFEHTGAYNPARTVFLEAARSSDIFVGLYADEYGDPVGDRPAPIEEEYLESLDFPLMPRLFLVRSSRRRQRRLRAFLQAIAPHGVAIRYEGAADFADRLREGLSAIVAAAYRDASDGYGAGSSGGQEDVGRREVKATPAGGRLCAALLADAEGPIVAMAHEAIAGLGVDLSPLAPAGASAPPQLTGPVGAADLLIVVLGKGGELRLYQALREIRGGPERSAFLFAHSALSALPELGTLATLQSTRAPVFYDGPADLHWKLAQAVAEVLSARFRQVQTRQIAMLGADPAARRRAVLRLAAHRDAGQRRLGARVALAHAIGHPQEQTAMAQALVGRGHPVGFAIAALVVQAYARHDAAGASRLLHELGDASPAFRAWVFARLAGG